MAEDLQLGTEEGDTSGKVYGVVVDIGTTSLVASLVDLLTGQELSCVSRLNPQARLAQDVLSRISFASNENGLQEMWTLAAKAINEMLEEVCSRAAVSTRPRL